MGKASEYEQNAEECLKLAKCSKNPEHKQSLQEVAYTWAALAEERRRRQQKQQHSH